MTKKKKERLEHARLEIEEYTTGLVARVKEEKISICCICKYFDYSKFDIHNVSQNYAKCTRSDAMEYVDVFHGTKGISYSNAFIKDKNKDLQCKDFKFKEDINEHIDNDR